MTREKGSTMTEATTEEGVVKRHAFYNVGTAIHFAPDDQSLFDLYGNGNTFLAAPLPKDRLSLLEERGTDEWCDRMVRLFTIMREQFAANRNALREKEDYLERLGQALLEKADENNLCEEYDAFAEEWDLPTRLKEFEVQVTVRVKVRNEDEARDAVKEQADFEPYNDDRFIGSAEYYVTEV